MNDPLPPRPARQHPLAVRASEASPTVPAPSIVEHVVRVMAALRRRWLSALAVFLFVLGGVIFYTWRQPLAYTATANLVVNARVLDVISPENGVVPRASDSDAAVNTEVQILQSREVAQRVVDTLSARFPNFAERITRQPTPRSRPMVANVLQGRLSVRRPGDTNVLGISFTAADPEMAALVANTFASAYIAVKSGTRLGAAKSADADISAQLESMRAEVESAEAAVAQYKAANNLLSAEGSTLTEQEVSLYRQQEAIANTSLAEDRARLNTARSQLRAGSQGDDVGEALGSQVIGGLRQQQAQLSSRVAELKARYQPGYPDLVKAQDQLAAVNQAIQAEIRRVVSNLEARVSVSEQRAATARGILGGARGELSANNAASVRLGELQRRADAIRSTYEAMLARRNAVTSEAMIGTDDARLFSPAAVPQSPSHPNRKLNLAVGGMLALLLAAATVALLQLLDRGIASSRDAERLLHLRHLANLPLIRSIAKREDRGIAPVEFGTARPLSLFAEALRNILLASDRSGDRAGAAIVAVTSSRPDEGKTTLAISLARMAAASGRRAVLIDGDVRRARVCHEMKLNPKIGLIDVLEERAPLNEALLHDEVSGCWVLPSLAQSYTASQFGAMERFEVLLGALAKSYELIIIDTPPVLAAAESRAIVQNVDSVIFAVRWNKTLLPVIRAALKRLRDVQVDPIGLVLTMVDMRAIARYGVDDVDYDYKAYDNYGNI